MFEEFLPIEKNIDEEMRRGTFEMRKGTGAVKLDKINAVEFLVLYYPYLILLCNYKSKSLESCIPTDSFPAILLQHPL